jgi:hypothetical protein
MEMTEEQRLKHNEKSRRWREANPDKHRASVRKSREKRIATVGRDRFLADISEKQRKRRAENPELVRQYERALRLKNRARTMVGKARERAKRKQLPFDLRPEDIEPLPDRCPVFGFELDYERTTAGHNSPTLDRVVNDKGYVAGNVIVVSKKANTMKSNGSVEDLFALYNFYRNFNVDC